jgi:hypothetical protein
LVPAGSSGTYCHCAREERDALGKSSGRQRMLNLLPLVFIFPLMGFVSLAFVRGRISENLAADIGVGSIGLSALLC